MTQAKALSVLLVGGLLAVGCGGGGNGSGDGSGSGGPDYSGTDGSGSGGGSGNGVDDDAGADALPVYPTQHPRIYVEANRSRLTTALSASTPAASRFRDVVDRWVNGSDIYGFQIWNAALMGTLTHDPKYCTKAVAAIDAQVAAEEAKIAAGAQPVVAQNSYLHIGDLIGDVALTYDWCFDSITAAQKSRWLAYANQAVWNVWHPSEAKWGSHSLAWTGWATNDPGDNYYYSFLRATALLGLATKGETPEGDQFITQFRDTKFYGQLVPAFEAQLAGGGSREGTAYGVSMRGLFHLYDIWYATTGEKLKAKTKHTRESMRAFMHQVVPTLDRFAPTGDQPRDMTAAFFDYQRQYLEELVWLYPNDPVAPRAKAMLDGSNLPTMARAELMVYDFLYDISSMQPVSLDGLGGTYFASGIGQLYARSGWDKQATWVNLTAGPYTEQHAHQDQGSLMIYKGGWLAYDAVINSANGIIQETGSHTMVRVDNGGTPVKQVWDTESQMLAVHQGEGWVYAAADVTPAFGGNAAVSRDEREVLYLKPNVVVVYDRVATAGGTSQVWQLATPTRPSVSGAMATITGPHPMTVQRLAPAGATTAVVDLSTVTGYRGGFRLEQRVAGGDVRFLHVLSLDGAATSATANGDSTVTITLADGKTATVAFNRDQVGATLDYAGAHTVLGAGVDALPE